MLYIGMSLEVWASTQAYKWFTNNYLILIKNLLAEVDDVWKR